MIGKSSNFDPLAYVCLANLLPDIFSPRVRSKIYQGMSSSYGGGQVSRRALFDAGGSAEPADDGAEAFAKAMKYFNSFPDGF